MSAAGGAYPIVPPLPEYERRDSRDTTSGTKGGTTTQELSEIQRQALEQQASGIDAQKTGTEEVRKQAEKVAGIEAQGALAEQQAAAWKLGQLSSQPALDADQSVARARENVKVQQARYGAMPAPKLFADGKGWDNARKAIGMALGGIGDAIAARASILAGHGMTQMHTVGNIIDMDIQRQKDAIDKQKDSVVMSRTGLSDAEEARRQLRGDIDLKAIAMIDNAKKLTVARLAAAKMDQPAIDQHQAVLALDQKKADYKANYVQGLTTSIQSGWDKSTKVGVDETHRAPTAGGGGGGVEADKNAANFGLLREHGTWLAQNMKNLTPEEAAAVSTIQSTGVALSDSPKVSAALSAAGIDPESGASSRVKAYLDHMSRANDAIGRLKSGGAINKDEDARFSGWFKVRPSDAADDRQMRADNVMKDIEILGQHLDRAARPPVPPAAGAPAAPPAPGQPAKPPGGAATPPPPANDLRSKLIAALKAKPARAETPEGRVAMRRYGIKPEELQ